MSNRYNAYTAAESRVVYETRPPVRVSSVTRPTQDDDEFWRHHPTITRMTDPEGDFSECRITIVGVPHTEQNQSYMKQQIYN
jgi:hypothetical protein